MKKIVLFVVIVVLILASMAAVAAPAFAAGRCEFVRNHGWHIVGGGGDNDHWFPTRALCLAALNPPTSTVTPTEEPTETPDPTETIVPTETVTVEPTETPVVTETPSPTVVPTNTLTQEPPIFTETPVFTFTPDPTKPVTPDAMARKGLNCQKAWDKITLTLYSRDIGFRFFDNPEHAYCTPWLLKTHGVIWAVYKVQHPLEN